MLARLDGALSGPASGSAEDAALRYVRANLAALGLQEDDLASLRPPVSDTVDGITTIRWRQAVDGIAAADSELRVNVDRDGRVLSVLGSPASGLDADTTPTLTAGEAVRVVQDDAGVHRALPRTSGGARSVTYADGTTAALALYTGRLVWRVTYRAGDDAVYDVMVDARTGKLLRRANLVKSAVWAHVWENHPGAAAGGGATPARSICDPWLDPAADATRLFGPNVHAYTDAGDDGTPQASTRSRPTIYAFVRRSGAPATPCSWTERATGRPTAQQNAVQAFYFANRFHDHLASLGFTDSLVRGRRPADPRGQRRRRTSISATTPSCTRRRTAQSPLMQLQLWGGAPPTATSTAATTPRSSTTSTRTGSRTG